MIILWIITIVLKDGIGIKLDETIKHVVISPRYSIGEIFELQRNYKSVDSTIKNALGNETDLLENFSQPIYNLTNGGTHSHKVVYIFVYHRFMDHPHNTWEITPKNFFSHLKYFLKKYEIIPLNWLIEAIYTRQENFLPDTGIVITIDDGYRYFYKVLDTVIKYHVPITHCIYTNFIGMKSAFTWDELRNLLEMGFDIQGHTVSHPVLTHLSRSQIFHELYFSKKLIEDELGSFVTVIAYPYGVLNKKVTEMALLADYDGALTLFWGYNTIETPEMCLRRIEIYSTDNLRNLIRKMRKSDELRKKEVKIWYE